MFKAQTLGQLCCLQMSPVPRPPPNTEKTEMVGEELFGCRLKDLDAAAAVNSVFRSGISLSSESVSAMARQKELPLSKRTAFLQPGGGGGLPAVC